MTKTRATGIEVRQRPYDLFNRWRERSMAKTAWVVSNNCYKTASGRVVTQWPYGTALRRTHQTFGTHLGNDTPNQKPRGAPKAVSQT